MKRQNTCVVCGAAVQLSFLADDEPPMHQDCARTLLPGLVDACREFVDICEGLAAGDAVDGEKIKRALLNGVEALARLPV